MLGYLYLCVIGWHGLCRIYTKASPKPVLPAATVHPKSVRKYCGFALSYFVLSAGYFRKCLLVSSERKRDNRGLYSIFFRSLFHNLGRGEDIRCKGGFLQRCRALFAHSFFTGRTLAVLRPTIARLAIDNLVYEILLGCCVVYAWGRYLDATMTER